MVDTYVCVVLEEGKTVYLHELMEGSDLFFCEPPKPERVSEWCEHYVHGCAHSGSLFTYSLTLLP